MRLSLRNASGDTIWIVEAMLRINKASQLPYTVIARLAYYTSSQSFLQLPVSASVAHVIHESSIYTPAKT